MRRGGHDSRRVSYVDVEVTGKAAVRAVAKDSERPFSLERRFRKTIWKDRSERFAVGDRGYRRGINPTGKDHLYLNGDASLHKVISDML